jgi:copper homeostasis protein CutC
MSPNGFEFGFTDEDGSSVHFTLDGISDAAADGIVAGLLGVDTLTDVAATKITEVREEVTVASRP